MLGGQRKCFGKGEPLGLPEIVSFNSIVSFRWQLILHSAIKCTRISSFLASVSAFQSLLKTGGTQPPNVLGDKMLHLTEYLVMLEGGNTN